MRKRELLKRIEELEKSVAILQQKVASIENKPIAPIQINPWIKENPPYTYPNITCWDNSTDGHSFPGN